MAYIQNIDSGIDDFYGRGVVNPNVVSGADLDSGMVNYYNYVADSEIEEAQEDLEAAQLAFEEAKKAVQTAGRIYGQTMGALQYKSKRLTLLNAIKAGTAKGTSYDGQNAAGIDAEIMQLKAFIADNSPLLRQYNEDVQRASYEAKTTHQEVIKAKEILDELTQRQVDEGKPPVENNISNVVEEAKETVSESPAVEIPKEVKKDLINTIAGKIGISRNQTIFALGGAAVLGIVLLTKK